MKEGKFTLGVGVSHPGGEFFFPLSSRFGLCMAAHREEGHARALPFATKKFNKMLICFAQRRICAGRKLDRLQRDFERLHGRVRLGENALIPQWEGKAID